MLRSDLVRQLEALLRQLDPEWNVIVEQLPALTETQAEVNAAFGQTMQAVVATNNAQTITEHARQAHKSLRSRVKPLREVQPHIYYQAIERLRAALMEAPIPTETLVHLLDQFRTHLGNFYTDSLDKKNSKDLFHIVRTGEGIQHQVEALRAYVEGTITALKTTIPEGASTLTIKLDIQPVVVVVADRLDALQRIYEAVAPFHGWEPGDATLRLSYVEGGCLLFELLGDAEIMETVRFIFGTSLGYLVGRKRDKAHSNVDLTQKLVNLLKDRPGMQEDQQKVDAIVHQLVDDVADVVQGSSKVELNGEHIQADVEVGQSHIERIEPRALAPGDEDETKEEADGACP